MVEHRINKILVDRAESTITVRTEGGLRLRFGFKMPLYFDLVVELAIGQKTSGAKHNKADIGDLLEKLQVRRKSLDPAERRRYGKLTSTGAFAVTWRRYLPGGRDYVRLLDQPDESPEIVKRVLRDFFSYWGSGDDAQYALGWNTPTCITIESVTLADCLAVPRHARIGTYTLPWIVCSCDLEDGLRPEDIVLRCDRQRVAVSKEVQKEWQNLVTERRNALAQQRECAWPGAVYGISSFSEQRSPAERLSLHLAFHPTDYFTFLATQRLLARDPSNPNKTLPLRHQHLRDFNPFEIIPEMCQSFSATILLLCNGGSGQTKYAVLARRSMRTATGERMYVLSMNETPRRRPEDHEWKLLQDLGVPEEKVEPDDSTPYQLSLQRTVRRGFGEELNLPDLPLDTLRFLSFGVETNRYQYALIGLMHTDLTTDQVRSAVTTGGKDVRLEYDDIFFVPFTPIGVYDFMARVRAGGSTWGPEAEIGLFQALQHCFGARKVLDVFEFYPVVRS